MIKIGQLESGRVAQLVGLVIAVLITTVVWYPPVISRFLPDDFVWRNVAQQAVDWIFALSLMAIVVLWEKRPLTSLGFKRITKENFFAGLGLGGFFLLGTALWYYLISPIFAGPGPGMEGNGDSEIPSHFIYWYAPLALVTASFCEEVIYRGYAMERLLSVTGRPWIAVVVSHLAFVLYHIKDGLDSVVGLSVLGLLFPLYYIKYRDLTMMIVAHAFIDSMAILGYLVGIGPR